MSTLQSRIEASLPEARQIREAVHEVIRPSTVVSLRVAEKADGEWVIHEWVRSAILLYFRVAQMEVHEPRTLRVPRQDSAEARSRRAGCPLVRLASFAMAPTSSAGLSSCLATSTSVPMWAPGRWSIPGPLSGPAPRSDRTYISQVGSVLVGCSSPRAHAQ